MKVLTVVFVFACISVLHKISDAAADTLTPTTSIIEGQELISAGQIFSLGFFSPGSSKSRYIGIWYKNIKPQTVVWVANREKPLVNDSSGNLTIGADGNIVLVDGTGNKIRFTNSSTSIREPIARLLDSGNLVLMDGKNKVSYIWQSFDYPTDTMLPGMKLGWDKSSGLNRYLTSWKSADDDPSSGSFTYNFDHKEFPELVIRQGMNITFRSGIWNGIRFNSDDWTSFTGITAFKPQISVTSNEVVYWDEPGDRLSRFMMRDDGLLDRYIWDNNTLKWTKMYEARKDLCDNYGTCGVNGVCNIDDVPVYCDCLKGFKPRSQEEWDSFNRSGGCIRKTPLNCTQADRFQKLSRVKFPMLKQFWTNNGMNLEECEVECLKDCSCTAYANSAINEGPHGCLLWFGDLIDMRLLISDDDAQLDLYVRLAASEIESTSNANKRRKVALIISASMIVLLLCIIFYYYKKYTGARKRKNIADSGHRDQNEDQASPIFDIDTILAATNSFSIENKIGEGGFGPVYRGKLAQGQEIAVKRLSKTSKQGITEFMNEVGLVAKLQHRNLVSVLGGCTHGNERMLVYEYMPNGSLNHFIFGPTQGKFLQWRKRYEIIMGIARGLLYLHQDSKLTIIHRDLKTSNILLDNELNPKISDFGVSHILEGDHSAVTTNQIVGTIGYMSPEYAVNGLLSLKSDVFSFGVIVLEILSGIRNNHFNHPDHPHNLLGQAWILWKEGHAVEFMDVNLDLTSIPSELLRCLQVGLLCVQKFPEDRPDMSSVVFMLGNESIALARPKKPGFFGEEIGFHDYSEKDYFSNNAMTITLLEARN